MKDLNLQGNYLDFIAMNQIDTESRTGFENWQNSFVAQEIKNQKLKQILRSVNGKRKEHQTVYGAIGQFTNKARSSSR